MWLIELFVLKSGLVQLESEGIYLLMDQSTNTCNIQLSRKPCPWPLCKRDMHHHRDVRCYKLFESTLALSVQYAITLLPVNPTSIVLSTGIWGGCTERYIKIITATLFVIVKTWKQPQ